MLLTTNFQTLASAGETLAENLFSPSFKLPKTVREYLQTIIPYVGLSSTPLELVLNTSQSGNLPDSRFGRIVFQPLINYVIPFYVIRATEKGVFATWRILGTDGSAIESFQIEKDKVYVYVPQANVALMINEYENGSVTTTYQHSTAGQSGSAQATVWNVKIVGTACDPDVDAAIPSFDFYHGQAPCLDPVCAIEPGLIDIGVLTPLGDDPLVPQSQPCGYCTTLLEKRAFHFGCISPTAKSMIIMPATMIRPIGNLPSPQNQNI